jgi:cholesterol transport system auxiliary component
MSQRLCFLLILCLASTTAGACVKLKQQYPERRAFVIEAKRPADESRPPLAESVAVRRFHISRMYEKSEFVYQKGDLRFESDFYNVFFVSPDVMITEQLRQWLKDSGVFGQTVDPVSSIAPAYIIEGSVAKLLGDYRAPDLPKAHIEIQCLLVAADSPTPVAIFQKDYSRIVAIKGSDAASLAVGLNAGFQEILVEFEKDLREALAK